MTLKIKDLREDNDLTQAQIAKILMCDQSLYSKYERGEREIPLRFLIILSDYYKLVLIIWLAEQKKKLTYKFLNARGKFLGRFTILKIQKP